MQLTTTVFLLDAHIHPYIIYVVFLKNYYYYYYYGMLNFDVLYHCKIVYLKTSLLGLAFSSHIKIASNYHPIFYIYLYNCLITQLCYQSTCYFSQL